MNEQGAREHVAASNELPLEETEISLNQEVGQRVKERRQALDLSLRKLGAMVGLTASALSQIERGVVTPSLTSLTAIARALDTPLHEFFVGQRGDSVVSRKGEHPHLCLPGSSVHYDLISRRSSSNLAVQRARLQPGHSVYSTPQVHPQEECLFVLKGKIQVQLGEQKIILEQYDAIHYDGSTPHLISVVGDVEAEYVLSMSPVVF